MNPAIDDRPGRSAAKCCLCLQATRKTDFSPLLLLLLYLFRSSMNPDRNDN